MTTDWLPACPACRTAPAVAIVVDDQYGFRYPHCAPCGAALARVLTTRHPEIPFHTESMSLSTLVAA